MDSRDPRLLLPLDVIARVLAGLEPSRNVRALGLLLGTFAAAGLLLSMAESSLARLAPDAAWSGWAAVDLGAALALAFYGANAAGLVVMDDARGRAPRGVPEALRDALGTAHRLVASLLVVATACAALVAALAGVLWLSRTSVSGPWLGPVLFGIAMPVSVVVSGVVLLALATVVVPLAAPAAWAGADVATIVARLARLVRERLVVVALLTIGVGAIAAAVAAMTTFVVVAGGRIAAEAAIAIVGVEVPRDQLMAGLFGYGLRSLGASGAPVVASAHGAAALIGEGVVFAVSLVLPGLVYLRGACAVYLALHGDTGDSG